MRFICLSTISTIVAIFFSGTTWAEDVPKVIRLEERLKVGELLVIGESEMATLPELDIVWRARIDSGATTTSLHAVDIEEFERDGKNWVRFTARNEELDTSVEMEKPVISIASIRKRGSDDVERRPVIETEMVIGGVSRTINVNLNDRTHFEFPVLIGRNYLDGITLIDVSRAYLHGDPEEER